jgi:hypothetical protein
MKYAAAVVFLFAAVGFAASVPTLDKCLEVLVDEYGSLTVQVKRCASNDSCVVSTCRDGQCVEEPKCTAPRTECKNGACVPVAPPAVITTECEEEEMIPDGATLFACRAVTTMESVVSVSARMWDNIVDNFKRDFVHFWGAVIYSMGIWLLPVLLGLLYVSIGIMYGELRIEARHHSKFFASKKRALAIEQFDTLGNDTGEYALAGVPLKPLVTPIFAGFDVPVNVYGAPRSWTSCNMPFLEDFVSEANPYIVTHTAEAVVVVFVSGADEDKWKAAKTPKEWATVYKFALMYLVRNMHDVLFYMQREALALEKERKK